MVSSEPGGPGGAKDAPGPGYASAAVDLALMERINTGDREAFGILVDRFWARLVLFAEGIVGSRDRAQDVVQETFVRVWRHRGAWKPSGCVGGYLYKITRNLALNAERASQEESVRRQRLEMHQPVQRTLPGPDEEMDARHLRAEIERAILTLPERRREIFILSRFHHLTHREIAEALELSPQTVANQLGAALAELRVALAAHLPEE